MYRRHCICEHRPWVYGSPGGDEGAGHATWV